MLNVCGIANNNKPEIICCTENASSEISVPCYACSTLTSKLSTDF